MMREFIETATKREIMLGCALIACLTYISITVAFDIAEMARWRGFALLPR